MNDTAESLLESIRARSDALAEHTKSPAISAPMPLRLGEILVQRGKLDPNALERTLRLQQSNAGAGGKRERIGELLVTLGLVAQREVTDALSWQLEIPVVETYAYPELPIL